MFVYHIGGVLWLEFTFFFFLLLPFPFRNKTTDRIIWVSYFFTFIEGSVTGPGIFTMRNPCWFLIHAYKPLDWTDSVCSGVLPPTFLFFKSRMCKRMRGRGLEQGAGDWSVVRENEYY